MLASVRRLSSAGAAASSRLGFRAASPNVFEWSLADKNPDDGDGGVEGEGTITKDDNLIDGATGVSDRVVW